MHAYFIDDWTGQKKFLREVDSLDLRLTQNGLSGRKIKLNRLHDIDASVRDLAENGIRTFVAIGNDSTANRLINSLIKLGEANQPVGRKFIFAILPVGGSQKIAASFNCGHLEAAIAALKMSRTKTIDLGLLNNRHYFVTAATFYGRNSVGFTSYSISSLRPEYEVSVCNANIYPQAEKFHSNAAFDLCDGILEAVVAYPDGKDRPWFQDSKKNNYAIESVFPFTAVTVQGAGKTIKVLADVEKEFSSPVSVTVAPGRLEVIINTMPEK